MSKQIIDMLGQHIGKWTVIKKSDKKTSNGNVYWLCQCECGTIKEICGSDLRRGKTLQCRECAGTAPKKLKKEIKSNPNLLAKFQPDYYIKEIGKRYGRLVVLSISQRKTTATLLHCRCDCGKEVDIRIDNLHSGRTQSCGCLVSKGEVLIQQLLKESNINYQQQYEFNDLTGLHGGKLRFDFAIFDKNNSLIKLIEFQGKQHYVEVPIWNNNTKIHDVYKREYCKKHNIELLEIPYYDINKIDLNYLGLITLM